MTWTSKLLLPSLKQHDSRDWIVDRQMRCGYWRHDGTVAEGNSSTHIEDWRKNRGEHEKPFKAVSNDSDSTGSITGSRL